MWAIKYNNTNNCLQELLHILKDKIPELPLDPRCLKKTPKISNTIPMESGFYVHYGLRDGLTDFLLQNFELDFGIICIDFNIDGLPIAKSSNNQVWPILGNIVNTNFVFLIGLYSGNSKPLNINTYLLEFITELKDLISNGFDYQGKTYEVKVRAFVCDTTARAFVLSVRGHSSYYSCLRCTQKGTKIRNRMTFPEINHEKRTNENFRMITYPEFHKIKNLTTLEEIEIDCVNDFVLDYMHIVCLGIVKTLLNLWVYEKGRNFCFQSTQIERLSVRLKALKQHIPFEFARTPRGIEEIGRWKATEFRQFLLYTGPFILTRQIHTFFKTLYGNENIIGL